MKEKPIVMIFAAGLGTRLRPLTDHCPKAMVPLNGRPLLEHLIKKLKNAGFAEMLVNVHHYPDMIIDFLKSHDYFGVDIRISDERAQLMDTGGALVQALPLFGPHRQVLVHNVDIITDLDLVALVDEHRRSGAQATLAVRDRSTERKLLFDADQKLVGWRHHGKDELRMVFDRLPERVEEYAYSGVQVLETDLLRAMHSSGPFSIIDAYLSLARDHSIRAFLHTQSQWLDVGKPKHLAEASRLLSR